MAEILLGPATATSAAELESLILDPSSSPVAVNNQSSYEVESFEYTPARPKTEWAESADTDGALPTNEAHYTNAEATLRIRIPSQASMDAALVLVNTIVAKGQKARRMVMEGERGLPVTWTPAGSVYVGTLYLLEADEYRLPMEMSGDDAGYFLNEPVLTVHMTFAPGVESAERTITEITSSDPVISFPIANILGDLRALAKLTVTDNATTARKTVKIGLERYHYDAASPSDLWLDEGDLTETVPSNAVADGDASGGNALELLGLYPGWQDVAIRTADTRRGTFRVWARVKAIADEEEIRVRLKWRVGAGPYTVNALAVVAAFATAAYVEVDLGIVTIPTGAANLDLIVQAQSDVVTGAAEGVRVDTLSPQPAERTSSVEGEEVVTGGQTLSVYDGFDHGAFADPLTGTAPELGTGNWVGAGDADDVLLGNFGAYRSLSSPDADLNTGRYVAAGSALGAMTVTAPLVVANYSKVTGNEVRGGIIFRYTDANNWAGALIRVKRKANAHDNLLKLAVYKRVTGTVTKLAEINVTATALAKSGATGVSGTLAASVDASGNVVISTGRDLSGAATEESILLTDSALASAGALGSGKGGLYHATEAGNFNGPFQAFTFTVYSSVSSITRTYAIPSGGRLEVDGSEAISYSAPTGGTAVPVALRGDAFSLEPAGSEAETTRVSVKVRDAAPGEAETVSSLTRSKKVKATYRPTYLLGPGP